MGQSQIRVIFFGAGAKAEIVWEQLLDSPFFNDSYIAFSDNNKQLWGRSFHSFRIIPPYEVNQYSADLFVVTSIYVNEIKKQLIGELGIPSERIFTFEEYKRSCYVKWIYDERYQASKNVNNSFHTDKAIIYTAITGDYDYLKEPLLVNEDCEYICFTNNKKLKSDIWNIEYIRDDELDNMMLAKKVKLFPDLYFKEYETSIWIDGKIQICDDLIGYVKKFGRNQPILSFPHHERKCIYEEAGACLYLHIGHKLEIVKQISDYYSMGYPINNGLYEMGCIVRQHNNELVKRVMREWWNELELYSYRDQISFPVVCWKNDFLPDICSLDIYKNNWLKPHPHNKNRKVRA